MEQVSPQQIKWVQSELEVVYASSPPMIFAFCASDREAITFFLSSNFFFFIRNVFEVWEIQYPVAGLTGNNRHILTPLCFYFVQLRIAFSREPDQFPKGIDNKKATGFALIKAVAHTDATAPGVQRSLQQWYVLHGWGGIKSRKMVVACFFNSGFFFIYDKV